MSYRLITRATLTVTTAAGATLEPRVVDVRAYPSPKREASGMLTLDGVAVSYKRTGGKGRGTADRRYAYFPMGTESAYIEVTETEATGFIGGQVTLVREVKTEPTAAAAHAATVEAADAAEQAEKQAAAAKAARRVKGEAKTA